MGVECGGFAGVGADDGSACSLATGMPMPMSVVDNHQTIDFAQCTAIDPFAVLVAVPEADNAFALDQRSGAAEEPQVVEVPAEC